MPKVNIDIYSRLHRSEKKLKEVEDRLKGVEQGAKKADSSLKGLWKQVAAGVGIGFGIPALTRGVGRLAGSFMEAAVETENYEVRLEALLGSQEKATEAMEFFEEVASKVPFTLQEVIESGTQLSAFGLNFKKWTPVLNDLAAVMGMRLPEAASALGRAFAGGAGAADIFRERGILQMIKDFAKMEKGIDDITKISLPEFREVMFETFTNTEGRVAGASDKLSTTWKGMVSMLSDAWFQFRKDIMEAGIFDMMKEGLENVLEWVKKFKEEGGFDETALKISALGEAIGYVRDEVERDTKILGMLFDILSGDKKRTDELTESNKRAAEAARRAGAINVDLIKTIQAIVDEIREETNEIETQIPAAENLALIWGLMGDKQKELQKELQDTREEIAAFYQPLGESINLFERFTLWPEKMKEGFQDTHYFIGEAIFDTTEYIKVVNQLTGSIRYLTEEQNRQLGVLYKWTAALEGGISGVLSYLKALVIEEILVAFAKSKMPFFLKLAALVPTMIALNEFTKGLEKMLTPQTSLQTGGIIKKRMYAELHPEELVMPLSKAPQVLRETFREVIREPGGGGSPVKVQVFIGNREIKDFVVKTVNEDEDIVLRTGKLQ